MCKFRFAIADWCIPVSGPDVCRMAAEAGLDGVELNLGEFEHNLPLTDPHVRRYYLDAQQRYGVDFCGIAVNALDKSFVMPPENPQRAAGYFREACDEAEKHGIIVSSENPMSVEDNLALCDLVDRPNFRLYFDNENPVYFNGANSAEMLRALGSRVCQIHVKDGTDAQMSSCHLGQGHAYFHECVQVIHEIGYTGWIVSENNYDMPPFNTFENDRFELLVEDVRIMKQAFLQES